MTAKCHYLFADVYVIRELALTNSLSTSQHDNIKISHTQIALNVCSDRSNHKLCAEVDIGQMNYSIGDPRY